VKVGIICEESGTVRDEFARLGHDAWSCDILPRPGKHITGDARAQDWRGFDLLICHPPCTYLCNSGVRWLHERPGRWDRMREAADFFQWCLSLVDIVPGVGVENPIPHRHAGLPPYDQIIQPWQFGHGETKATCLWLRGLPPLEPTKIVSGREGRVWKCSPGPNRSRIRSQTYPGIARAMAEQWTAALCA
jgi:hypothetical protein